MRAACGIMLTFRNTERGEIPHDAHAADGEKKLLKSVMPDNLKDIGRRVMRNEGAGFESLPPYEAATRCHDFRHELNSLRPARVRPEHIALAQEEVRALI